MTPLFRPVADHGVLVEFGDRIDPATHDRVMGLDQLLAAQGFAGFQQAVPAYVNLLVVFDPLVTDHVAVTRHLVAILAGEPPPRAHGTVREVLVCYDADLAPDLPEVARLTGLTRKSVIGAHLTSVYDVVMYGFAPGYAYLAGVPDALKLPRKPAAVRGVPAGSVLIAGGQCLVSTLRMPTGWWVIGRSPTRILTDAPDHPFLFDPGDQVRFRQIDRALFDALGTGPGR